VGEAVLHPGVMVLRLASEDVANVTESDCPPWSVLLLGWQWCCDRSAPLALQLLAVVEHLIRRFGHWAPFAVAMLAFRTISFIQQCAGHEN
jgi:hypothetical protein